MIQMKELFRRGAFLIVTAKTTLKKVENSLRWFLQFLYFVLLLNRSFASSLRLCKIGSV